MNFRDEYKRYQESIRPPQDFVEDLMEKRRKAFFWRRFAIAMCLFVFLVLPSAYFAREGIFKSILGKKWEQVEKNTMDMEESISEEGLETEQEPAKGGDLKQEESESIMEGMDERGLLIDYVPNTGNVKKQNGKWLITGENTVIEIRWAEDEDVNLYSKTQFTLDNLLAERKKTFILEDGGNRVYIKIKGNLEEAYTMLLTASWLE